MTVLYSSGLFSKVHDGNRESLDSRRNLFPVHSRAPGNWQFYIFQQSEVRDACDIWSSAFTSFQLCWLVLPARLSVILRTRLSVHSFSCFVLRLTEMFHPFRLPAFSFLSSNIPFLFNRYYAVLVLDRENWEIQSNNPWDFSTGCFRASATLNEPSLSSLSYFSRYSFYSFPHGRQQTTTKQCQQGFCRSRVVRKKENDGKLSSWWSLYGRYVNNRKYPCCHIIDAI